MGQKLPVRVLLVFGLAPIGGRAAEFRRRDDSARGWHQRRHGRRRSPPDHWRRTRHLARSRRHRECPDGRGVSGVGARAASRKTRPDEQRSRREDGITTSSPSPTRACSGLACVTLIYHHVGRGYSPRRSRSTRRTRRRRAHREAPAPIASRREAFAPTRAPRAQALILAGKVHVGETPRSTNAGPRSPCNIKHRAR